MRVSTASDLMMIVDFIYLGVVYFCVLPEPLVDSVRGNFLLLNEVVIKEMMTVLSSSPCCKASQRCA